MRPVGQGLRAVIEWATVWAVVGPIASGFGTWFITRKPRQSAIDAAVAQSKAQSSVADAEGSLYNRLRERLDALETDVTRLRTELDKEREHGRKLERHIWKLEGIMRKADLTPPEFVD